MTATRRIDTVEVAKMLRRTLKESFHGVKFSVRSSRYSMGCSIDVYWTDGPSQDAVQEVCNLYQGATFDSMIDLKSHHDTVLVGDDGPELVHMAADYVFAHRTVSEEYHDMARAWWARKVFYPQADKRSGGRDDVHPAPDDSGGWVDRLSVACDDALDRAVLHRWTRRDAWPSWMIADIAKALADIEYERIGR